MNPDQHHKAWKPGEILSYERRLLELPQPPVSGKIIDDVIIPARGFLKARHLKTGQTIRFIDIEGQQVVDVMLFEASNLRNVSSMTNSILMAGRHKLSTGDGIFAKFGQKMATISADTVGHTCVLGGFCNSEVNEARYRVEGTSSCRMNFVASMAEYNFGPQDIEEGCFSPFMDVEYKTTGEIAINPPSSKPGDHFDLTADMDIIAAVSNCPSERNDCNAWNPTPLRVLIIDDQADG